jgi:two-component system cell cycle response regulator DivK
MVTLAPDAPTAWRPAVEKAGPLASPKTVLVVEDNELNMKLFNDLLETQGYRVVQARTGPEALAAARRFSPDLILMDIQLPEISGLQVTQEILKDPALADVPIIAITAFAMKGDEERIRAGGCRDYIAKPISVAAFLEKVKRYLD